jgi:hypothetical protein
MTLPAVLVAEGFNPEQVTPGVIGFIATAAIGVLIVLLLIDMNRRIRRNTYRAQIRERLEAERRAAEADEATDAGTDAAEATPELDLDAEWREAQERDAERPDTERPDDSKA